MKNLFKIVALGLSVMATSVSADNKSGIYTALDACDEGAQNAFCDACRAYLKEQLETRDLIQIGFDSNVWTHIEALALKHN